MTKVQIYSIHYPDRLAAGETLDLAPSDRVSDHLYPMTMN